MPRFFAFPLAALLALALACPQGAHAQIAGSNGDTVTLRSGVRYISIQPGTGERPVAGQKVSIHYTGKLESGKIFDTSRTKNKPFKFTVGRGDVIPGLDQVVALLKVGQQVTIFIPARLAYGPAGQSDGSGEADSYIVPPNSDLIFDVELLAVK